MTSSRTVSTVSLCETGAAMENPRQSSLDVTDSRACWTGGDTGTIDRWHAIAAYNARFAAEIPLFALESFVYAWNVVTLQVEWSDHSWDRVFSQSSWRRGRPPSRIGLCIHHRRVRHAIQRRSRCATSISTSIPR